MPDVKDAVPTFFVADVRKSAEWYERVLGFRIVFFYESQEAYAGVELGPARIHLAGVGPGRGLKGACYLRLNTGVDEYVATIEAKGQQLVATVKDHPDYGMREATVRDPDGNDIYIGQPL